MLRFGRVDPGRNHEVGDEQSKDASEEAFGDLNESDALAVVLQSGGHARWQELFQLAPRPHRIGEKLSAFMKVVSGGEASSFHQSRSCGKPHAIRDRP